MPVLKAAPHVIPTRSLPTVVQIPATTAFTFPNWNLGANSLIFGPESAAEYRAGPRIELASQSADVAAEGLFSVRRIGSLLGNSKDEAKLGVLDRFFDASWRPTWVNAPAVVANVDPVPSAPMWGKNSPSDKEISQRSLRRLMPLKPENEADVVAAMNVAAIKGGRRFSNARLEAMLATPGEAGRKARIAACSALGKIYAAMIRRGLPAPGKFAEELASVSDDDVAPGAIAKARGQIYAAMVARGQAIPLEELELQLFGGGTIPGPVPLEILTPVYLEMIDKGQDIRLAWIEGLLDDPGFRLVRRQVAVALSEIYVAMIRRGIPVSTAPLDRFFEDKLNWGADTLELAGNLLAAKIENHIAADIEPLVSRFREIDHLPLHLEKPIARAVGQVYAAMRANGMEIPITELESQLNNQDDSEVRVAAIALGRIYAADVRRGVDAPRKKLIVIMNGTNPSRNSAATEALTYIYVAMIEQGRKVALAPLYENWKRNDAVEALGTIFGAMLRKGVDISRYDLENKVFSIERRKYIRVEEVLTKVYVAMAEMGHIFLLPAEQEKLQRWRNFGLPYADEQLAGQYAAASDGPAFIQDLKAQAEVFIQKGFDPNSARERALAYTAVRSHEIEITQEDFDLRVNIISPYQDRHPEYFRRLFVKTAGLPAMTVSGQAVQLELNDLSEEVLYRNAAELDAAATRIRDFSWIEAEFPKDKGLSLRNIYYQFKRSQAQDQGLWSPGQRFSVAFPDDGDMEIMEELLRNPKAYYRTVFEIARARLGERRLSKKLVALMRDLILTDAYWDMDIRGVLVGTGFIAEKIVAFRTVYEDYKNHLPDSMGIQISAVKGLARAIGDFCHDLYVELAKTRLVVVPGETDVYRLVPQGFLAVFRGRMGIIDCSFNDEASKGRAYTRAMHEDTIYYSVHKGNSNAPKGYIGMMLTQLKDGRKVLAIDTINSPSLDGVELLSNLFRQLVTLAKKLDCVGIALPADMDNIFNFENKNTIAAMPVYMNATDIELSPVHEDSWRHLEATFGSDVYNSIYRGKFKLLSDP